MLAAKIKMKGLNASSPVWRQHASPLAPRQDGVAFARGRCAGAALSVRYDHGGDRGMGPLAAAEPQSSRHLAAFGCARYRRYGHAWRPDPPDGFRSLHYRVA